MTGRSRSPEEGRGQNAPGLTVCPLSNKRENGAAGGPPNPLLLGFECLQKSGAYHSHTFRGQLP